MKERLMNKEVHSCHADRDWLLPGSPGKKRGLSPIIQAGPLRLAETVARYWGPFLYVNRTYRWRINAFDQWGVELGKEISKQIHGELTEVTADKNLDASTRGLIELYRKKRKQ